MSEEKILTNRTAKVTINGAEYTITDQNGNIAIGLILQVYFEFCRLFLLCNGNYCCALGSGVCLRFMRTPEWRKNEHTEHGDNRRKIESTEIEGGTQPGTIGG